MLTFFTVVVAAVVGLGLLMLALNLTVMWRMMKQRGQPVPELPGDWGSRLRSARQSLLYFFSPGCAACVRLTPKMKDLRSHNLDVHLVDVTREYPVARAFRVLATPSTVEIRDGRIVDVHVGLVPPDVLARYAA